MAAYLTLIPANVQLGRDVGVSMVHGAAAPATPPAAVGGGSVADDSDSSYLTIGADMISGAHCQPVDMDFQVPAGVAPTAIAVYARMRTATGAIPFGTGDGDSRRFEVVLMTTSDEYLNGPDQFQGTHVAPLIINCTQTAPLDAAAWWWDADLNNPTDSGNWRDITASSDAAIVNALTGSGLRVSFFLSHFGTYWNPLVDLFEFRLLVAYDAPSAIPPLRLYPRSDGLGLSSARRVWPPSRSRQRGLRPGPGSYL